MAHRVKKIAKSDKPGSAIKGSIMTKDMVMQAIETRSGGEDFYELEPLEVLEVCVDDTLEKFPLTKDGDKDYSFTGAIFGRFVYSEQGLPKSKCSLYKPSFLLCINS